MNTPGLNVVSGHASPKGRSLFPKVPFSPDRKQAIKNALNDGRSAGDGFFTKQGGHTMHTGGNRFDLFGNLTEWGRVLEQLEELKTADSLEDHQAGLVRILRYRDNWRLREWVLQAVRNMKHHSREFIQAIVAILLDEELYQEVRILAAEGLGAWLRIKSSSTAESTPELELHVVECLQKVLTSPQPPVIHQAIRRVLPTAEG